MREMKAKVAQSGFSAGPAFVCRRAEAAIYQQGIPPVEAERLAAAVAELDRRLGAQSHLKSRQEAELVEAERMLLHAEEYAGRAAALIEEEQLSAVDALKKAEASVCEGLSASGNAYIMERCADVKGLTAHLIGILTGSERKLPEAPCILVSDELSPSDVSLTEPGLILGIVTEKGSPTSHVSVLAGNLGVPYLYGLKTPAEEIRDGDRLILDGKKGCVVINPTEDAWEAAEERMEAALEERQTADAAAALSATKTRVTASISGPMELDRLPAAKGGGIGLVRSEFLFLNRKSAPSEEEQLDAYRRIISAAPSGDVVIRTMDLGSDKRAEWLTIPGEPNPALGMRGLRASLAYREVFRTQLRALLRAAAAGNLKIMVPMVTEVWEIDETLEEINKAAEELAQRALPYRIPELGIMIETPASVMIAPELAEKVSFFSIGTNDLMQYTLAIDRETQNLDEYCNPLNEAVFRMIALTVEAAHGQGIPVTICGELGGNPAAIERLLRLGVDELSVSVGKLAQIRKTVADVEAGLNASAAAPGPAGMPAEAGPAAGPAAPERAHIKAPADGELIPMEEIPDEAFASGLLGTCLGILPTDGTIYAPISGTVRMVAKTRHAISFVNGDTEILLHVGIDTVRLNGEGFTVKVEEGQRVEEGQIVMEADLALIREKGFNPMVIVVRIKG